MKIILLLRPLIAGMCAAFSVAQLSAADSPREHLSLDAGWKFHLGDDWPDALHLDKAGASAGPASENIQRHWLAHGQFAARLGGGTAVRPELPTAATASSRSGRVSRPTASAGIAARLNCRRSDAGKRIWLTFDGVMRDATVWVNGWLVRRHEGGYYPFREDITDVVHFGGKNTIAVRVDATEIRGLVLRRRGHLPPRLAGQDRAGGHRAGRDFCLFQFQEQRAVGQGGNPRRSQSPQHAHQRPPRRRSNCEIISPGWQAFGGSDCKLWKTCNAESQECREIGIAKLSSPVLWSPEDPKTLQARHNRFQWTARWLTKWKLPSASAPWALTRRTAFC